MSEPTPNEGSEMAGTLTRVDGPTAGCVVTLPTDQLTIGRSKRADLHLTDEGVSRKHARICWVDGAYVLEDLGSQNGSVVCGKKVSAVELKQGDLIRIGPVATLRFCWMDAHQKGLLDELYETSVRDPLTGAYNRRHFSEQLEAELAYAKRHKSELSLLLLDIDHFKRINDEHGHQEGDRVLEELTRVAHRHLRTEDVFSRYGGEEFALILRGVPLIGAARAAERLRLAIAAQVSAGTQPVSVSIGCAALGALEEGTAAALIQVADQRLYEAKQTGRGRVVASGASTPR
jgi:diguanylate cyclase (GGDEF)-like protein